MAAESSRIASDQFLTEERLLNQYPVVAPDGARGKLLFRSVLGLVPYSVVGTVAIRAFETIAGNLFVAASGRLYRMESGTAVEYGSIVDSDLTTISGNANAITVAAGGTYYVWAGAGLLTPGSGRFTSVGSVAHINGRTIISEMGGDEIEWTAIGDPTDRDALSFSSAETILDEVLRVVVVGSNVWAIGAQSIELFGPTGLDGADAFTRISGGVMRRGCLGALLNVVFDPGDGSGDNLWWIGDDKVPYRGNSISPQPLPRSSGVIAAIEAETPTHCFYYEDQGHKFFCIRFAGRPAWCYDATMGFWHERSTGVEHGPWAVIDTARLDGIWYAATEAGTIYRMARTNADGDLPLRRTTVFRPIDMGGKQFSVSELELVCNAGAGNLGRDMQAMLRVKRDGRPWSGEMWRSMGSQGEYGTRTVWRMLGSQRLANYEISVTEPADVSMLSDMNVEAR